MNKSLLPRGKPPAASLESAAEKHRRIGREAEMLAQARASAAAGQIVDEADVDAWIDSIGTDHELPPPYAHI